MQRNPVPQIRFVQIACTRATLKKNGKHRQMFVLYREMNRSFQEQIGCTVVSSKLKEYPCGVNVPCRNRVQEWGTAFIITCVYFGSLFNEKCDEFRLVKKSSPRDKKSYKNVSLVMLKLPTLPYLNLGLETRYVIPTSSAFKGFQPGVQ